MATIKELRSPVCGRSYSHAEVQYTCPVCGSVGTLEVLYDYEVLKTQLDRDALRNQHEQSMWRYKALLPIEPDSNILPLRAEMTPFYDAHRVAQALGLKQA